MSKYMEKMMPGISRICAERKRQMDKGYDGEHDKQHEPMDLFFAGWCYLTAEPGVVPKHWPFEEAAFKPKDRVRNLERAGAFFLAAQELVEATQKAPYDGFLDVCHTGIAACAQELDKVLKNG